ncbi:hypothetical protein GA0070215_13615 [Micromonospora marina]|uniref:Uncharacterized protein n=1 Tax=Micromonospora marina TaxID=307120 RepID=A0A1C5AK76_9ACTN|nr:hypothetical protein GA0070215_13615 [Micromonospora marina]
MIGVVGVHPPRLESFPVFAIGVIGGMRHNLPDSWTTLGMESH